MNLLTRIFLILIYWPILSNFYWLFLFHRFYWNSFFIFRIIGSIAGICSRLIFIGGIVSARIFLCLLACFRSLILSSFALRRLATLPCCWSCWSLLPVLSSFVSFISRRFWWCLFRSRRADASWHWSSSYPPQQSQHPSLLRSLTPVETSPGLQF